MLFLRLITAYSLPNVFCMKFLTFTMSDTTDDMIFLRNIVSITTLFLSLSVNANTWYVATNGSDTDSGTEQNPFLTIGKAVSMVQAGEIIFVRGELIIL
jgi:hypothetical protein